MKTHNDKVINRIVTTGAFVCAVLVSACKDPYMPFTDPVGGEVENCAASEEWLSNGGIIPSVTLFKPLPHPTGECPFYCGVWQNFLIAMQPIDAQGTPALMTYP